MAPVSYENKPVQQRQTATRKVHLLGGTRRVISGALASQERPRLRARLAANKDIWDSNLFKEASLRALKERGPMTL